MPPLEVADRPKKRRGSEVSSSKTLLPAIFLYIVAGLSIINHAAGVVMALTGNAVNPFAGLQPVDPNEPPNVAEARRVGMMVGGIIGGIIGLTFDGLVIGGAYCLQSRRFYGMALTGAIVAVIPCLGPCLILGMPFGIWALVVLSSADVKASFR